MKTTRHLLALVLATLGLLATGCMMSQAATKLSVEKDGLKVKYSSPKDQHVEYNPETGEILVKSTSNEALVNAAGVAQAEAMGRGFEVLGTLAEKVK